MFYLRLNSFRQDGETDSAFANRLKISRQLFEQWKSGHSRPNHSKMTHILRMLGISEREFWCGVCCHGKSLNCQKLFDGSREI